ncbi:MAG: aminotransferase [Kordia sp.]|nr:MAG: aminotransferase [Kordia sp.]
MIPFLDVQQLNARFESVFKNVFADFLNAGQCILGNKLMQFENEFAEYCGTKHCVGVASGLDAITLLCKGYIELGKLKVGDEVLVSANTYIASILGLINAGLIPVLVEPNENEFIISVENIEKQITTKIKMILAVHLYGELADMKEINVLAKKHGLLVIEDAAQAHGAVDVNGVKAGNLSDGGAFSFYPSKNLGALGDGGAITTNNQELFAIVQKLRNYGASEKYKNDIKGVNSRLDELQAAFLSIKLKQLDADNNKRRVLAKYYFEHINNNKITLPSYNVSDSHVFHVFVIKCKSRNELQKYLLNNEIQTVIHYPIPPHKQKALKEYGYLKLPITEQIHDEVLSLPISPIQTISATKKIVSILNKF